MQPSLSLSPADNSLHTPSIIVDLPPTPGSQQGGLPPVQAPPLCPLPPRDCSRPLDPTSQQQAHLFPSSPREDGWSRHTTLGGAPLGLRVVGGRWSGRPCLKVSTCQLRFCLPTARGLRSHHPGVTDVTTPPGLVSEEQVLPGHAGPHKDGSPQQAPGAVGQISCAGCRTKMPRAWGQERVTGQARSPCGSSCWASGTGCTRGAALGLPTEDQGLTAAEHPRSRRWLYCIDHCSRGQPLPRRAPATGTRVCTHLCRALHGSPHRDAHTGRLQQWVWGRRCLGRGTPAGLAGCCHLFASLALGISPALDKGWFPAQTQAPCQRETDLHLEAWAHLWVKGSRLSISVH